jgi:predicted ABC-type transport system involved in lysophospholipase L1 biosynthesis ATPase subunit
VSDAPETPPVLRLTDGLWFGAGPESWALDPLRVSAGSWVALVPGGEEPVVDPAGPLARILSTLIEPVRGTVELMGQEVSRIEYRDKQMLRARLGFVQGYGGLLSNRTLRENIALPVSIHSGFTIDEEEQLVDDTLFGFALDLVGDRRPHEVDGATRWRACLARALVLSPEWVVLEGIGDWEVDRGKGIAWTRFCEFQRRGVSAAAICLSRQNPAFEAWFGDQGGEVVRYFAKVRERSTRSSLT